MWFSDRRRFLTGAAALAALSACGFRPVYGPDGAGTALRGAIRLDDPASAADYAFLAAFEDRLGRPTAPRYALAYRIEQSSTGAGIVQNFGATRVQVAGVVDYTVTDIATGRERAAGRVDASVSYSTTATQLASQAAAEDAEQRLMRMLADRLVTRIYTEPGLQA